MRNLYEHAIALFFCHWVSTLGVVLTSASAIVFVAFQFQDLTNPYQGLIVFLIVPALFLLGLLLVPIGLFLRSRAAGGLRAAIEATAWDRARLARLTFVVLAASLANVALMSAASYRGLEYMDSDAFCGLLCHNPMSPHYEVHQFSPHANVRCVECHVGPGPTSFLQAKLAGIGRVADLVADSYPRPLRLSDINRTPVADACEGCHARTQTQGEPLRLIRHYDDDRDSTPLTTALLMRVDTAIHAAHVGRDIYYIADDLERQTIPWVSVDGIEYVSGDVPEGPRQLMDCLDCHNRAAHSFASPEHAVDQAIGEGRIDRSTPFAKRDTLQAVLEPTDPQAASVAVTEILQRNVFPSMNITWDTYPDNIGHESYPGCFRCHDGQHAAQTGQTITRDCLVCHGLLAIEEETPAILDQLGIAR